MTAADIVGQVCISAVFRALAGKALKRTERGTFRARATWRGGDGWSVSLDDRRGVWRDHVTGDGGGVLDLVVRVRGGSRADALHWCADFAGVPLSDTPLSPGERAEWAREQQRRARELPAARLWRRAAAMLTDELLDSLKAGLTNATLPQPVVGEICNVEQLLTRLRRIDGVELVSEYHSWMENQPKLTAGMVHAARLLETAERRALERYLGLAAQAERCA